MTTTITKLGEIVGATVGDVRMRRQAPLPTKGTRGLGEGETVTRIGGANAEIAEATLRR